MPTFQIAKNYDTITTIRHLMGHMFGLRDRQRNVSVCFASVQNINLISFLKKQSPDEESIMAINGIDADERLMLSSTDISDINKLYNKNDKKLNSGLIILLVVSLVLFLILCYAVWYYHGYKNKTNNNNKIELSSKV